MDVVQISLVTTGLQSTHPDEILWDAVGDRGFSIQSLWRVYVLERTVSLLSMCLWAGELRWHCSSVLPQQWSLQEWSWGAFKKSNKVLFIPWGIAMQYFPSESRAHLCRQFTFLPKQLSYSSPWIKEEMMNLTSLRAERREICRDCSSCEEFMLVLTGGVRLSEGAS